jgi:DNA-binding transcriptional LysR family regulator
MAERSRPDISLNEMRTLVAISKTGTFTAAAKELGISQPAVSRQLLRLEQRLGVSLFERDFRQPHFTPSGEQLLAYAKEMVRRFDEVMSLLCCQSDNLRGELRLEASTPYLFTDWSREFSQRNPEVKLHILFSDSMAVEEDVLDGTADFGLIGRLPSLETLPHEVIGEDEVVLAVPAAHPFANRAEIELEELRGQPFITCFHRNPGTIGPVKAELRRRGLEQPERQVVMSLESDYECLRAVSQGIGLSWVTNVLFRRDNVDGAVPVRIKGLRFRRTLYLLHSTRPLTQVGRAFLESLRGFDGSGGSKLNNRRLTA